MQLQSILRRGLRRLEDQTGNETCTINGAAVPCLATSLLAGVVLEIGGNPIQISLTLFIRLELLITADSELVKADDETITADNDLGVPVSGKVIQFRNLNYRVLTTKRAAGKSHVELHLADPFSGKR